MLNNIPVTASPIQYLTRREIVKKYDCKGVPSVTKVLSNANPGRHIYFKQQMKDKESCVYKATVNGLNAHKALETGECRTDLEVAVLNEFNSSILPDLDEVWGREEFLYHPDGFTGKFDGVGVFRGKLTLFDYKKTHGPKKKSGLKKYFSQLVAYRRAHEYLYDFKVEQLAVFNLFGKTPDEVGSNVVVLTEEDISEANASFNSALLTLGRVKA